MFQRIHVAGAAALLLSTALSGIAVAGDGGGIDAIRLSSGGLAEISRKAVPTADGTIQIEVPFDQVDDILKSLVLNGNAGTIDRVSLAGPRPLEETFKGLPFTPETLASAPALLASMQGTVVSVTSGGKTVTGKVLGVETRDSEKTAERALLTVLGKDDRIDTLKLGDDAALTVEDPEMRQKLADAVAATGRAKNDGARVVNVHIAGTGGQEVRLNYVIAAPIWKTAYRVVVGKDAKARLQAWAILENASGVDWKGVKIALSSADPVTLKQRLHQLYWKERSEVVVNTASDNVAAPDTGNLLNRVRTRAASDKKAMMAPAMETVAEQAAVAPAPADYGGGTGEAETGATATESDTSATFDLPGSYDLTNGDTLSVPIADASVEAQMVSVYTAGSKLRHPIAAIKISNSTGASMPGGILTVYDANAGYIGDAELAGLPKGDTRMASFATDRKVTVTEDRKPTQKIVDIKVVDGAIRTTEKLVETTTYTISGALDGERTIVIEHPVREGWSFVSQAENGRTATHHRLQTNVEAGGEASVTAVDELLLSNSYTLADAEPDVLLGWSSSASDKGVAEKLARLAEARRKQVDAHRELEKSSEDIQRLAGEQERIRENIGTVPENSDLKTKYLKILEESETSIARAVEKREAAQKVADLIDEQVRETIRQF